MPDEIWTPAELRRYRETGQLPGQLAPPQVSEKAFQAQVVKYAQGRGWLVYHTYDSRRSVEGFPDTVMVRRQRVVYAELKVGKEQTSQAQDAWLNALREAATEVYVWRPSDWETIVRRLT